MILAEDTVRLISNCLHRYQLLHDQFREVHQALKSRKNTGPGSLLPDLAINIRSLHLLHTMLLRVAQNYDDSILLAVQGPRRKKMNPEQMVKQGEYFYENMVRWFKEGLTDIERNPSRTSVVMVSLGHHVMVLMRFNADFVELADVYSA